MKDLLATKERLVREDDKKLAEVFDSEYRKIGMEYLFEYLRDLYLNDML